MRRRGDGAIFREPRRHRRPRVPAVERRPTERASLIVLARRSLQSVVRHARLYVACVVVLVLAQVGFGILWSSTSALEIAGEVLGGAFTAIVTATAFGDVAGLTRGQIVERAFDRSWAVIVIGFGIDLFASDGLVGLLSGNFLNWFLGFAVLLMTSTLMFAPVDATISNDDWWRVLPSALSRSILTAWRTNIFSRAIIVLVLGEIAPPWLLFSLQSGLVALHVGRAALWASGLSEAILLPAVQTFATLVYLDAIGYESKRPCSE